MPEWAGSKSWVEAIETGALLDDTINYYIAVASHRSRSGYGLQARAYERVGNSFNNTPYTTALLEDFRRRIEDKLKRTTVAKI
jgi:hypothetical protein